MADDKATATGIALIDGVFIDTHTMCMYVSPEARHIAAYFLGMSRIKQDDLTGIPYASILLSVTMPNDDTCENPFIFYIAGLDDIKREQILVVPVKLVKWIVDNRPNFVRSVTKDAAQENVLITWIKKGANDV